MKIVLLMILVFVLISFFGTAIVTLLTWFSNGGSMIMSTLGIFTDFFSRALSSMFNQPYIQTILAIFLFCTVVIIIVSFLRGSLSNLGGSSDDEDDTTIYTETDSNGRITSMREVKRYKHKGKKFVESNNLYVGGKKK